MGPNLPLSSCANSRSIPEQLGPLALDHRGPTATEAGQQKTRTSLHPQVRPVSLETSLLVAPTVNIRDLEVTLDPARTQPQCPSSVTWAGCMGHPWELSSNVEGVQGRFQELHYLSSRMLRRAWASLKQP